MQIPISRGGPMGCYIWSTYKITVASERDEVVNFFDNICKNMEIDIIHKGYKWNSQ